MIEIHTNDSGEIVIEQDCNVPGEAIQYISFWPEHAQAIIGAINRAVNEATARALGEEVPQ